MSSEVQTPQPSTTTSWAEVGDHAVSTIGKGFKWWLILGAASFVIGLITVFIIGFAMMKLGNKALDQIPTTAFVQPGNVVNSENAPKKLA